jgi:hypothetical protein
VEKKKTFTGVFVKVVRASHFKSNSSLRCVRCVLYLYKNLNPYDTAKCNFTISLVVYAAAAEDDEDTGFLSPDNRQICDRNRCS